MIEDRRHWLGAVVGGALLIGALSTLGDMLWYELPLRHRPVYGLAHGTLLFLAIGLYLGAVMGRPWTGGVAGAAIGFGAAAGYYALASLAGVWAMFVMWMAIWVLLAGLVERLARRASGWQTLLARAGAAAIGSGIAFYAISGIWLEQPAGGRRYGLHLASWTVAYLPAFLALLWRRR